MNIASLLSVSEARAIFRDDFRLRELHHGLRTLKSSASIFQVRRL